MKKNLFLVSALLMSGMSSFAADWVKPVLEKNPVVPVVDNETQYYLYNKDAKGFLVAGNNWGTRACVAKEDSVALGYKVRLAPINMEGYEDYFILRDSCEYGNKGWKDMFVQGSLADESIYMDRGSQDVSGAYYKLVGDPSAYTIENYLNAQWPREDGQVAPNALGLAAGRPTTEAGGSGASMSTGAYTLTSLGEEATEWMFISAEAVENFKVANAVYAAYEAFQQKVAQFTASGFDCSSYVARIPAQAEATVEAVTLVDIEMTNAYAKTNATPENPVDMTNKIVNPSFENGTTGWSAATGTTIYGTQTNTSFLKKDGTTYAEFWHKNGNFSIQQVIKDMPEGVYQLSAYAHSSNESERLYVNDNESEAIIAQETNTESFYTVSGLQKEAGDLLIGVKANDNGSAWNTVDNFGLKYLGNSGAAWATMLPQFAGKDITKVVADKYFALVEALKNASAADKMAAYEAAKAGVAEVEADMKAWEDYNALLKKAKNIAEQPSLAGLAGELADYVAGDYILPEDNLKGTDDVKDETVYLKDLIKKVIKNLPKGTDITFLMVNNDFADGWNGWTHEAVAGGNVAANATAKCAEGWNNADFNVYQEIEDAPTGVYKIEVQGFYRYGRGAGAWTAYFDEATGEKKEVVPESQAFVYLNDKKTALSNVFDYPIENGTLYTTTGSLAPFTDPLGTYWYPNDMTAAGQAFDEGLYIVNASGLVANDGDQLRIGVKGNTTQLGDSWAIFTRFKLIYMGFDQDVVSPEFDEAVKLLDSDKKVGTEVSSKINALKAEVANVDKSNGEAMFNTMAKIYALQDEIDASAAEFDKLKIAQESLLAAIEMYAETAKPELLSKAGEQVGVATQALSEDVMTTAEVTKLTEEINTTADLLPIPAYPEGADIADFTGVIKNPSFETGDATGWNIDKKSGNPGFVAGAIEYFEKTYDLYQDIKNLPAGTYEIEMNGFYRQGSTDNDYDATTALWNGEGEFKGLATFYAAAGSNYQSTQLSSLTMGAQTEAMGIDGEVSKNTSTEEGVEEFIYVPNNMTCAVAYMQNNYYVHKIRINVAEGATLRIGVKQDESVSGGWMICTGFKLTAIGAGNENFGQEVAVEEVAEAEKAENGKFVKDGQVIIVVDGKTFSANGSQIK